MVTMEWINKIIDKFKREPKDEDLPRTIMTEETNNLMDEVLTELRNYIYDEALNFVAERGPPYIMLPEDIKQVINAGPIHLKVSTEKV